MQTGATVESRADMLVLRVVLYLLLLAHHSLSAPQVAGSQKVDSAEARPPPGLANPFGSSEDERRLLRSYIQAQVKEGQWPSELNTWEQDVFFLFSLHDYDRSGRLDGLEMMKLLSDFNAHNAPATETADRVMVVSMVDFLLQTQDPNQDGLLAPSELLSPPKEPAQEEKLSQPEGQDQEVGEGETKEEGKVEENQQAVEKPVKPEELQKEEQKEPHIPEAPAAEQEKKKPAAPVHQGQPEM
ncbi:cell growth regulator with EF hand domain protein 1 [Aplochiton taeniatus]